MSLSLCRVVLKGVWEGTNTMQVTGRCLTRWFGLRNLYVLVTGTVAGGLGFSASHRVSPSDGD